MSHQPRASRHSTPTPTSTNRASTKKEVKKNKESKSAPTGNPNSNDFSPTCPCLPPLLPISALPRNGTDVTAHTKNIPDTYRAISLASCRLPLIPTICHLPHMETAGERNESHHTSQQRTLILHSQRPNNKAPSPKRGKIKPKKKQTRQKRPKSTKNETAPPEVQSGQGMFRNSIHSN